MEQGTDLLNQDLFKHLYLHPGVTSMGTSLWLRTKLCQCLSIFHGKIIGKSQSLSICRAAMGMFEFGSAMILLFQAEACDRNIIGTQARWGLGKLLF